jgi:5'-3' exoribonuclease 1
MGVPRFYRWLAKRYPAFAAPADAGHMTHVDNLYLDLNGIVHGCSHNNDEDDADGQPPQRKPDAQIFIECFRQIAALVELVRPAKVLYLALDGVAPRAKLNQQRARRFSSAAERGAHEAGEERPAWFDSNCITPGTEFMCALGEALVYLVQRQMRDDSSWAGLEVLLSTTAVPGEGEHKIMEYIRQQRHAPGCPPDTVHCAYGADADLILLALATHEPHFLVLRCAGR